MHNVLVHFLSIGIICMIGFPALYGQEICDNGVDDNADGLIDLNDTITCACETILVNADVPSLIPNHSFEEYTCCPTQLSEMYCAEDWEQASFATTDFMHNCGFVFGPVQDAGLLPFPDGDGIVGAYFVGPNDYNEYVGACLSEPLLQGTSYQLTFHIATLSATGNGQYCDDEVIFDEPIEVVLFGTNDCNVLPWSGLTCPLISGTGWQEIGSVSYETGLVWSTVTMNFIPDQDITTIALGSACTQPEPVTDCYPYVVFDNLLLNESALFNLYSIEQSGNTCDNSAILSLMNAPPSGDLQWYFDGVALVGETDSVLNIVDNGYGTGTYTLRITEADFCGVIDFVVEPPVLEAVFSVGGGCMDTAISFTNETTSDLQFDSSWDFGDGSPLVNGENATHIYTIPGIYEVELTVTAGECQSTSTNEIEILPPPEVSLNSAPVCSGEDIFINSETNSSQLSYQWTGPEGFSSTSPDVVIANAGIDNSGSYILVVTDSSGCSAEAEVLVAVYESLQIEIEHTLCSGDSLLLPDSTYVSATGTYSVSFPLSGAGCDSTVITDVIVSPEYFLSIEESICDNETYTLPDGNQTGTAGIYTVELLSESGCDSILEVQLIVNPIPVVEIDVDPEYCFDVGSHPLNPIPAGGNLQGDHVVGNSLDLSGVDPGTYSVSYTFISEDGCSDTLYAEYNITAPVFADFEYSTNCNTATFVNLTNDPQNNYNYEWSLEEESVSTEYSFQYSMGNPIEGEMVLTVSDEFECSYSTMQRVTLEPILDLSTFYVPNIISPNGDQVNDVLEIGVDHPECLDYRIILTDRWGNKVYEQTDSSAPFAGRSITGAVLSEGVYFYYFESPEINCSNPAFAPYCKGSITIVR